jgi:hypothetical protein
MAVEKQEEETCQTGICEVKKNLYQVFCEMKGKKKVH